MSLFHLSSMARADLLQLLGFTLAAATVVRGLWTVIYQLYFHPLAKVPGPFFARAFYFYSFWYNLNGGRLYLQIQKLHEQYGMRQRTAHVLLLPSHR